MMCQLINTYTHKGEGALGQNVDDNTNCFHHDHNNQINLQMLARNYVSRIMGWLA